MKKFLVLMLVLGLASAATAAIVNTQALVQITINGVVPDPVGGYDWVLDPSDWIELDIDLAPDYGTDGFDLDLEIIGTGSLVIAPLPEYPNVPVTDPLVNATVAGWSMIGTYKLEYDSSGVTRYFAGAWPGFEDPAYGRLLGGLIFHCDGPGDVIIRLTSRDTLNLIDPLGVKTAYPQAEAGDVIGEILIHNTPEPATLALLGLGGLFLRRRK